jgi:hypothetical protein
VTASPLTEHEEGTVAARVLGEIEDRLERTVEHYLAELPTGLSGDAFASARAGVLRRIGRVLSYEN